MRNNLKYAFHNNSRSEGNRFLLGIAAKTLVHFFSFQVAVVLYFLGKNILKVNVLDNHKYKEYDS